MKRPYLSLKFYKKMIKLYIKNEPTLTFKMSYLLLKVSVTALKIKILLVPVI